MDGADDSPSDADSCEEDAQAFADDNNDAAAVADVTSASVVTNTELKAPTEHHVSSTKCGAVDRCCGCMLWSRNVRALT